MLKYKLFFMFVCFYSFVFCQQEEKKKEKKSVITEVEISENGKSGEVCESESSNSDGKLEPPVIDEKNYLTLMGGVNTFGAGVFLIEYKPSFYLYKKLNPFIGFSGNMYGIYTVYSGVQLDHFIRTQFFISPQLSVGYASSINIPFIKFAMYSGWQFNNFFRFGGGIGYAAHILNPINGSASFVLFYSIPF